MNEYLIVIEKTRTGYSAYSPDIDGCISVGETKEECEQNMKEALKFHIEMMLENGYEVPNPKKREAEFIKINYRKALKKQLTTA
ncbi:MAG: type II toxin-antitoxin system HicB family antitoxin [bacterium]